MWKTAWFSHFTRNTMCKTQVHGLAKHMQTKWGLACIGAVSLKMNHSSCNDNFWLALEGYARAYYRILHAIYNLPHNVGKNVHFAC